MTSGNWMFGDRLEIRLELHLDGNLHVGSGEAPPDSHLRGKSADKDPEVSAVQRDKDGNAIIPATSLKGALRAQAPLTPAGMNFLLGEQGDARKGEGRIGRLWLGPAPAADGDNSHFAGMTKNKGLRKQGFVKTGVSIDRRTGTAEDKLLYNREMIGKGVKFTAKAILFLDGGDPKNPTEAEVTDHLAHLLAPLARDPGLSIGGQHRQAGGRLRLDDVSIIRRSIDALSLDLKEEPEPDLGRQIIAKAGAIAPRGGHRTFRLDLTCDGPFISMRDESPERVGESKVTEPLRQPDAGEDKRPLLWASSLLGALRARAAWLAECDRLRKGKSRFAPDRKSEDSPKDSMDDRKAVVRRKGEIETRSSVERLFGVAGWRGLLSIASLEPAADCPIVTQKLTSVTIDRFTGGAMDERLFTEETFLGAKFTAELRLESRAETCSDDAALLDLLFEEVQKKGVELGHGAAKGFGWFEVGVKELDGGER